MVGGFLTVIFHVEGALISTLINRRIPRFLVRFRNFIVGIFQMTLSFQFFDYSITTLLIIVLLHGEAYHAHDCQFIHIFTFL